MTHLRQITIEEFQRRNFAETTIRSYVQGVEHFSRYFDRSPDQLGPEHIRKYQAMLLSKLKFSPKSVIRRSGSTAVLLHQGAEEELERCRDALVIHLPEDLSRDEVAAPD